MAFRFWQIGLHIQPHEVLAVAVVRGASGWLLQRWWRMPLDQLVLKEGYICNPEQLSGVLQPWSRELPHHHAIHLSFPSSRTLQRRFPRPAMALREREQTAWLTGSMARDLDMDPDSLRFDYSEDSLSSSFNVTAAQSKEVSTLLTLMQTLKMRVTAITPDACALQRFIPYLASGQQCLVWRDDVQWLWATRYAWGRKTTEEMSSLDALAAALSMPPDTLVMCGADGFDPWDAVSVRLPPVPPQGHAFAISLGLAIGEMR